MVKVVLLCFILTRFGSISSSFVSLCQAAAAADSLLPVLGKKKSLGESSVDCQAGRVKFSQDPLLSSPHHPLESRSFSSAPDGQTDGSGGIAVADSRWGSEKNNNSGISSEEPQKDVDGVFVCLCVFRCSHFLFLSWL